MSKQTKKKASKQATEKKVDAVIEEMKADLLANPNSEDVHRLREKHNVTFDITGTLVEVREPKRLRKAIKKELEAQGEQSEPRAKDIAQKLTRGASKTGEIVAHAVLDVPVEGAKTAGQVVKGAARNAKEEFTARKDRRMDNAEARKELRKKRKAARLEAKAEEEKRQAKQEEATEAAKRAEAEARLTKLEKSS